MPAASVQLRLPVHTNGVVFAGSVEVCAVTAPNVRPVPSVSASVVTEVVCEFATTVVSV